MSDFKNDMFKIGKFIGRATLLDIQTLTPDFVIYLVLYILQYRKTMFKFGMATSFHGELIKNTDNNF